MKISLVSFWNEAIADLAAVTWPNKQAYCQKHGYACIGKNAELTDRHPLWGKLLSAKEQLPNFDWIFLADVDGLVTNDSIRLESFLDTSADLIFTSDINGLNFGFSFWRNTPWSARFLDDIWNSHNRFSHYPNQEQAALAHLLYAEPKDKWVCLPQRAFNSFDYRLYNYGIYLQGQWQPGDFVLHLPAIPNDQRISIFNQYIGA